SRDAGQGRGRLHRAGGHAAADRSDSARGRNVVRQRITRREGPPHSSLRDLVQWDRRPFVRLRSGRKSRRVHGGTTRVWRLEVQAAAAEVTASKLFQLNEQSSNRYLGGFNRASAATSEEQNRALGERTDMRLFDRSAHPQITGMRKYHHHVALEVTWRCGLTGPPCPLPHGHALVVDDLSGSEARRG